MSDKDFISSDYEWHRSSFCASGACVEVAVSEFGDVLVRDSKLGKESPVLSFTSGAWARALENVRNDWMPDGVRMDVTGSVEWGRLQFTESEWHAFVRGVRAGEFDFDELCTRGVEAGSGEDGSGQAATGAGDGGATSGVPAPVARQSGPAAFRRKPIEAQAIQYTGNNPVEVAAFIGGGYTFGGITQALRVHVGDGVHYLYLNDWALRTGDDVDVLNDSAFAKSYEPAPVATQSLACTHQAGCPVHGDVRDCEPVPVAAQPRYVLDAPAILELVERYGDTRASAAVAGRYSYESSVSYRANAADLLEAIRGALTPVPDVEPEPAWGSGPLVKLDIEGDDRPYYPAAGICRCGADGHGPGDNLCVCRRPS